MPKTPERAAFGVYPQAGKRGQRQPTAKEQLAQIFSDDRAMELPRFGEVDLEVPTAANRAMGQRMVERDVGLKRQADTDMSPLEKLAGGMQAGRLMGSGLVQAAKSIPTAITKGGKAAEDYIAENIYKPNQPKAYEYAGDIGDFLSSLETDYKLPPMMPEAMALQHLVGPAAQQARKAVPQAVRQGALNLAAPRTLNPEAGVIKMKGGNWLGGSVEKALEGLKRPMNPDEVAGVEAHLAKIEPHYDLSDPREARELADMRAHIQALKQNEAINNWVDRNLGNYVKKEMGTPEDPIRRLAEEGITHLPQNEIDFHTAWIPEDLALSRMRAGFPTEGLGQSNTAKGWEAITDSYINSAPASEYTKPLTESEARRGLKSVAEDNPWLSKLDPDTPVQYLKNADSISQDLRLDHIMDVLREDLASGRIRPDQLNKVSMEQAVRRTVEYDQELADKMNAARSAQREGLPVYKEYPEGYRWVELNKPGAFASESEAMGHSVRGYEPPQGHPDWVAGSGDRGSLGYGHGGWEGIKSGKAKVYSLVDPKGEPHVTVEVGQNKYAPRWDSVKQYMDQAREQVMKDRSAKGMPLTDQYENEIERLVEATAVQMAQKNSPPMITQIKGKQNEAPSEAYLPFVQDLVKSGQWADVGDLGNTGLIDTRNSLAYQNVPSELWKAHENLLGKDVPRYMTQEELRKYLPTEDGMAHGGRVHFSGNPETMQLELAGGGLVGKLAKAAKPAPMKASEALGRIEGRPLVITQSDRTKVGGGFLGGPGFSGLQLTEPEYRAAEAAWGVKTPGVAKMILGGGKKAGPDPVYTTFIGTPNQHQSNQMVFDKLYGDFKKSAKKGDLDPELKEKINYRLANAVDKDGRPIFPPDVDILDKNFKDLATTFDQRAVTSSLIGGYGVGGKKGQIIDYDKIIRNTTDPALIDAPSGSLGNRLFTLSGGIIDRPDLHPAFPTILQGEDLGVSFEPVIRDLVMKDFIEKTMREKGRAPGYMDYTRGHPPSQLITEDILSEMQKLGLKNGGAVRKAVGGEITADDLILEERKL